MIGQEGLLAACAVPESVVFVHLGLVVRRFLDDFQGLVHLRVLQQIRRRLLCCLADFGKEAEPQDLHLLLGEVARLEFRQLDEHEVQSVQDFARIKVMDHAIVMVVGFRVRLERLVDEIERINRLKQMVLLALGQLPNVCLGGVEENALLEGGGPVHLHFDDELASARLLASDIHGGVLAGRGARHKFRREIFYGFDFSALVQGQKSVEKAYYEVLVFAENLLECQIRLGIQIFTHLQSSM